MWWEKILVALIPAIIALIGTVITVRSANSKTRSEIKTEIAVVKTEMVNLKNEVQKHNDFASRVPVLEEQSRANRRDIEELKRKHD